MFDLRILSTLAAALVASTLIACGGVEDSSLEGPLEEPASDALLDLTPIPPNLRVAAVRVVGRRTETLGVAGAGSAIWTTWTLEADVVNDGGSIFDLTPGPDECGGRFRLSYHHLGELEGFPNVQGTATLCLDGLRSAGARVTRRFSVSFPDYARERFSIGAYLSTVVGVDLCLDRPATEVAPARCWVSEASETDNYRHVRLEFSPSR